MTHQAQKISSFILGQLNRGAVCGSVHSAFESTVNILCGDAGPGSAWVSVHAPDIPMHPHAVLLDAGEHRRAGEALLGARAGEPAKLSASGIVLGGGRAVVRLGGAAPWNPWLEPLERASASRPACRAFALLRSLAGMETASPFLDNAGAADGLEAALANECRAIRGELAAAWRLADMERACRAMMRAVGLGRGLTPSGDDFLVGFIGAAHFFACCGQGRGEAARALGIERSMTTVPAFFMLKGALAGFLPEPLSLLLRALAGGDDRRVHFAARRLMELGATSGQDMLAGVLCYLEAAEAIGERQ